MSCSTSIDIGESLSVTRKRSCARSACCSSSPSPVKRCCDDNCLIEIARRDCKNEHNHLPSRSSTSSAPSPEDEEPCQSHLTKAKAAYSEILNNIGCICQVLLSLNLESCCAPESGARTQNSEKQGLLAEMRRASSERRSIKSSGAASCAEDTCCSAPDEKKEALVTVGPSSNEDDCASKGCCTSTPKPQIAIHKNTGKTKTTACGSAAVSGVDIELVSEGPLPCTISCCKPNKEGTTNEVNRQILGCSSEEFEFIVQDQTSINECGKGCCSEPIARQVITSTSTSDRRKGCCSEPKIKPFGASTESCCSGKVSKPIAVPDVAECGKGCCSEPSLDAPIIPATLNDCAKGCCSEEVMGKIVAPMDPEDECGKGCCSEPKPFLVTKTKATVDSCCSPFNGQNSGNNTSNNRAGCSSKPKSTDIGSDRKYSKCGGGSDFGKSEILPYKHTMSTNELDLEKGVCDVEHLIISVQGMTCTGCEKSLEKALLSMPAISNIKTSLVLGRAEFDLRTLSDDVTVVDTIKNVEKMTGFTCSKMTLSGHELDLNVENTLPFLDDKNIPYGISDITALDTRTIRVVYSPEVMGARDLMGHPFFESAKLAPMAEPPLIASGRAHLRSMFFKTIVSTVLTIPVLVLSWADLPPREVAYGATSLVLATIVQVYVAGPWYLSAFKALFFSHLVEVDFLVVLSTSTAYMYSIIAYGFLVSHKPLSTGGFFETSTLLVTLIMVGRLVTSLARQRAVESISIESLQPSTAILINPKSDAREEIDARLLQYGDLFVVLPDSSITTDGTVISGVSDVDESMITGEATLVPKQSGSPVVAGSINHSGTLTVRLTRLMGDNTIKAIGLMVDEAKSSKARFQDMADRVAAYFVPVILIVTVIVFVTWVGVGKGVREYSTSRACINAMTYAISALIVSCPCAIGLAVPMVLVIAGGVAAKHGVIFKSAETIEKARNVSHVVFDKTGTLTQGLLTVQSEIYPTGEGKALGPMILGLTSSNKHPVSVAIAMHLKSSFEKPDELKNVTSIPGCGIQATWGEENIRAGNPYWLCVENLPAVRKILSTGVTVFCITVNKGVVALYGLQDNLRPDSIAVVNELKNRNIEISIVSGDNEESVKTVSRALDLPESHVRFRCSPADKQTYIKEISTGKNVVMFCGDGTNDAVALAEASIGVHVNGGTDIAQSAADAVLVRPALGGVIVLIDLSRAFYRRVVFNFTWSFVYNTFAILLAAGAFPNARISPQYAGLGEIVSVLPVIAVGVQLRWANFTNAKV